MAEISNEELIELISKYRIDLNEDENSAPILLSIGEHQDADKMKPTEFATEGNFSVISGAGKSKKSFFKSLLVSAYIGGRAIEYAPDIKSHRVEDKWVLDFDTEQSRYHAQKVFRRTKYITGDNYKRYMPFSLREIEPKKRVDFIEKVLTTQVNIGLVIIDGIADLVNSVNDLMECNKLVQKLMAWSSVTQCHIVVIIHTNFDSEKSTGHLGSAVMKKAETICVLKNNKEERMTEIAFTQTRGIPIEDMELRIVNHLPMLKFSDKSINY